MRAEIRVCLASALPTCHVYTQSPWAPQLTPAKALTCPFDGSPQKPAPGALRARLLPQTGDAARPLPPQGWATA